MGYWQDKVVIVTGGSAGLGLALCQTLIRHRAIVFMVARDEDRLVEAAATMAEAERITTFACDVSQDDQVQQMVQSCVANLGKIDALIHCVGKSSRGAVLDTTVEAFRESLEVNFLTAVRCTTACLPHLLESQGHLVHIGSLAAKSASRFLGAYPASKFAMAAYVQQLRLELAERDVHSLLVCPGPIARADAGRRYTESDVPDAAKQPGGGVKLKGIDPQQLSERILQACERRKPELVIPAKARLLFAISQLSASWGDWLVTKMTR